MIPGKKDPEKWSSEKWSPEKWPPEKMVPGKLVPGKMVPGKLVPRKVRNEKSWGERRASWYVCGMFWCNQSMKTQNSTTNTKLGNKAKTGNKKSWGKRWASWCVCVWNVRMWSIYENPKLDNKSSWTPLVFYSLVHMYDRDVSIKHFFVCLVESIDKNEKFV